MNMEERHTVEIERCWLIDRFPDDMAPVEVLEIYQTYLSISPEVRIRKLIDTSYNGYEQTYALTIKGKGSLRRVEVEIPISYAQYEALDSISPYKPIHKIRKTYEIGNDLRLECNLVEPDTEDQFMYADVEFSSEEAATSFIPLPFFGEEVTNSPVWFKDLRMRPKEG